MPVTLSRDQLHRVDQLAVERYGIPSLVLMENAGRGAAELIHQHYGPNERVVIFCGTGNNGGDGCVIARHLHNLNGRVHVVVTGDESAMSADTHTNFAIMRAMNLEVTLACDAPARRAALEKLDETIVVIDALLGTGFHGEIREPLGELTYGINRAKKRAVVAIDLPSGLDCDTGHPSKNAIQANRTITFVAHKKGFLQPEALAHVGVIQTASIGAPRELLETIACE